MLKKHEPDPSHVISHEPVSLQDDLTYIEEATQILDRNEQVLKRETIPIVKVF